MDIILNNFKYWFYPNNSKFRNNMTNDSNERKWLIFAQYTSFISTLKLPFMKKSFSKLWSDNIKSITSVT